MSFRACVLVHLASLLISVSSTDIHWECLAPNVEKCEAENQASFIAAIGESTPDTARMCQSIEDLIECAQIDCGGEGWDPTDDYLTKQLNYARATGLCGAPAQTAECATQLSKTCMAQMATYMKKVTDACVYYGIYAGCIIQKGARCQDETTAEFVAEMQRQLREKMPTVFGATTVDMCPRWPRMYRMFTRQRVKAFNF